jgi:accessory gene regulator protein AgrB
MNLSNRQNDHLYIYFFILFIIIGKHVDQELEDNLIMMSLLDFIFVYYRRYHFNYYYLIIVEIFFLLFSFTYSIQIIWRIVSRRKKKRK